MTRNPATESRPAPRSWASTSARAGTPIRLRRWRRQTMRSPSYPRRQSRPASMQVVAAQRGNPHQDGLTLSVVPPSTRAPSSSRHCRKRTCPRGASTPGLPRSPHRPRACVGASSMGKPHPSQTSPSGDTGGRGAPVPASAREVTPMVRPRCVPVSPSLRSPRSPGRAAGPGVPGPADRGPRPRPVPTHLPLA